jgi:hypothetical protein
MARKPELSRRPFKVAPAALVLLCAMILAWSGARAQAAYHFFAAQASTERMLETTNSSGGSLADVQRHLDTALARFPGNPDYRDFSGGLKELRARQPGVLGAERAALLESAADDYRASLRVRPLWPYSWVNLLSAKDKLGQVDSEFNRALNRAVETGPWEPRVQLQVLRSGLRQWDALTSGQRALVRDQLASALQVQPRGAFEIARFYARADLLCPMESGQPQIERWCKPVSTLN